MFLKNLQRFLKVKQTGYFDEKTRRAWKNYCYNQNGMNFYANVIPSMENLPKDFCELLLKKPEPKKQKQVKEKQTETPVKIVEEKIEWKPIFPKEKTEKEIENPILPEEPKPTLSELEQVSKPTIVYGDVVTPEEPVDTFLEVKSEEQETPEKKEKRKKNK